MSLDIFRLGKDFSTSWSLKRWGDEKNLFDLRAHVRQQIFKGEKKQKLSQILFWLTWRFEKDKAYFCGSVER